MSSKPARQLLWSQGNESRDCNSSPAGISPLGAPPRKALNGVSGPRPGPNRQDRRHPLDQTATRINRTIATEIAAREATEKARIAQPGPASGNIQAIG